MGPIIFWYRNDYYLQNKVQTPWYDSNNPSESSSKLSFQDYLWHIYSIEISSNHIGKVRVLEPEPYLAPLFLGPFI